MSHVLMGSISSVLPGGASLRQDESCHGVKATAPGGCRVLDGKPWRAPAAAQKRSRKATSVYIMDKLAANWGMVVVYRGKR